MSERCDTCRFYYAHAGQNPNEGRCRRYPPSYCQPDADAWPQGNWPIYADEWTWPMVEGDAWCGEYQAAAIATPSRDPLDTPIEGIELSTRTYNCLKSAGIDTVRDLTARQEDDLVCQIKNLGRASLAEVKAVLGKLGLKLYDRRRPVPKEPPPTS